MQVCLNVHFPRPPDVNYHSAPLLPAAHRLSSRPTSRWLSLSKLSRSRARCAAGGFCSTRHFACRVLPSTIHNFTLFWTRLQADLLSMRKSLGDKVAYFERDGSAIVDNVPSLTIELPDTMATIDAAAPWG